ncbi:MAG: hypothetical protein V4573_09330 [Pseudomonadota bacterium]
MSRASQFVHASLWQQDTSRACEPASSGITEMLFICAMLVSLPSVLPEHSARAPERENDHVTARKQPEKAEEDSMNPMATASISSLKNDCPRAKNRAAQLLSEGDFHFSGVNLQQKDSKKMLFPYEMRFFSSSIRIAIGE